MRTSGIRKYDSILENIIVLSCYGTRWRGGDPWNRLATTNSKIGSLHPYCPYWAPNAYAPQNSGHPDLDTCGCDHALPDLEAAVTTATFE